jgi:succinate-semialdehyde dehydrogenase/glutarate-semialdehyde dehydrogenase
MKLELKNKDLLRREDWAKTENFFEVFNPADNSFLEKVPCCNKNEVLEMIKKAKQSFLQWSKTPAKERCLIMQKWFHLILENQEDIAKIMVAEQGKPLQEANNEIVYGASFVQWFSEQAKRIRGEVMSDYQPNITLQYTKEAVGVVGIITPWNFPVAMITRKAAPAIAAGCSVIIKPSELTPLSALALAKLAKQAGLPAGVLQIASTSDAKQVGEVFCQSKEIQKISFTGSTKVGKVLFRQCADSIKRMSLELGGNAAFIVLEDADLDKAAENLLICKFRNSGQTCVCANRIFVQEGVLEEFLQKFKRAVKSLKVGGGMDSGTTQGPLIQESAVQKVEQHISQALADGAQLELGGARHALGGTFFEPTILTNVKAHSIFWREETFGPVAPICSFRTISEVIELANATDYGLANYFCTQDAKKIHLLSQKLQSGIIGVNTGIISNEFGPFGGFKESGIGREGSEMGIEEYLETKYSMISYQ